MIRRQSGFTLIELMLAVCIAVVVMMIAIPSLSGLNSERRLRESWEKFDDFAKKAQTNAIQQQRSWMIRWDAGKLVLQPAEMSAEENEQGGTGLIEELPAGDEVNYSLTRPAALLPAEQVKAEWTFWRSGTCEPVEIGYSGPEGTWKAVYNPLTGHGDLVEQVIK